MSTTTSHTPPESEGQSDGAAPGAGVRPPRLIQNEATTEIPVHLLFRDGPDPVRVPLAPALVGRRQGTGERPRPGRLLVGTPAMRCRRALFGMSPTTPDPTSLRPPG
ncbi:SPFH domain-containing protein, partial [Streptomyces eurythermus]